MIIRCASPTCAATIVALGPRDSDAYFARMKQAAWSLLQLADDDYPRPYCERCVRAL